LILKPVDPCSGRDIDLVKGAGGVVQVVERGARKGKKDFVFLWLEVIIGIRTNKQTNIRHCWKMTVEGFFFPL